MASCLKLTMSSPTKSLRSSLSESTETTETSILSEVNATSGSTDTEHPETESTTDQGHETGGWKKSWTVTEWVEWIVPGPILTVISTSFIGYLYGPVWATGTCLVLVGIDCYAFYYNA
eukprot:CAMPEP_0113668628 /NCGR_PEP_ID=MMETSP0038_2-20120614/4108_1 /TAXON_ID=2898 /ORGANISM="Cryptomonas paramecium" /LENGTH=117 /DNA_ID=CAMNT_0000584397 /DNA_START=138 /DNA_END=491 /DNA_ORIENTATION=+ /assembly_acc=CAM_ASM_000170